MGRRINELRKEAQEGTRAVSFTAPEAEVDTIHDAWVVVGARSLSQFITAALADTVEEIAKPYGGLEGLRKKADEIDPKREVRDRNRDRKRRKAGGQ